ncbi:MAG: NAD(P)-dependent alcohol dehydrogenase [Fermentimonas sp.]|nr:NAD(P)-dependent alcohol dehydrogenase [Fermentimonas sp.]MDD4723132.1 NAD(P)-dependent alcohol dehydrogenase [Fermentimonas sp.]
MMKAAVYEKYGPPEVVRVKEIAIPQPKGNELLIKVYASTVNRTDCGFRSAEYFVSRFFSGLFKPKFSVLGCEFAGIVEETGTEVTKFKNSDRVFGFNDETFGGHAEYMVISENKALATIPDSLSYEDAAPITEGSHYALESIRAAKVKAGDTVMVYGATGAIGSAAIQLLKHLGAHVTAVCNTKNVGLIKSLGPDIVIDYQTEDFTKTDIKFSFIFDAVGKSSFKECKPLLTEKGIYISTELGKNGENIWLALTTPLSGGKKVLFPLPGISQDDVKYLKFLVESGEFRPVIERHYNLDDIVDAYKYVETGQKTGKDREPMIIF